MQIRSAIHHLFTVLVFAQPVTAQWVVQTSGTQAELRGLSVVSPAVAWASGQRGTVIRTTNGGVHWTTDTVSGASTLDLRSIAATSPTTAFAMSIGDSSRIFRTTDGGHTWSLRFVSTRKGSFFDAIRFWDAKHGIAVSDPVDGRFLLVATSDGGETWQEVPAERLSGCRARCRMRVPSRRVEAATRSSVEATSGSSLAAPPWRECFTPAIAAAAGR